jgi:phage terminase large subunit-like protein
MSSAERYARDVEGGKVVAGEYIRKAAKRFIKDLNRKDLVFDEVEADKVVKFVEKYLYHWEDKWRGTPIVLEPWQKFILQQIYGWMSKDTGLRRVRKVFVEIAKKNSKTTIAAMISLYHLFADERVKTPKVFVGANNEDQAKICVNTAGRIIEQSPFLYDIVNDGVCDLFQYKENIVNIVHRERDGFIKAMAKEPAKSDTAQSGGKHGINPSLVVIDEYAMADGDNLLNTMESAQGAREEPLLFCITTAGHKQQGPCYLKLRKTGIEVTNGTMDDDSYLAFIWEPDENDDINDDKTWIKSNPNLGVSVFPAFLKSRLNAAKNEGGSKEVDVKTFNFNMWVDSPEVWISGDTWKINSHGLKEDDLRGLSCFGGLEILQGLDLHCFSLIFPNVKENIHAVLPFFWMAEGKVVENRMRIDCGKWVKEGVIKTCPGDVVDNEVVFNSLLKVISEYNFQSMACGVKLESHDILQGLARNGVEWNPISMGYQGQSTPTAMWEEMITGGKIEHFNNPVLAWMNGNCMVIRSKDMDMKVARENGRTSGIIASIYALAQWKTVEANPEAEFGIDMITI